MKNIKILSLNIEGDKHLKVIKALIQKEKPDVACFQEVFEQDFYDFLAQYKMRGLFCPMININQAGIPGFLKRGAMGVGVLGKNSGEFDSAYYFKKQGDAIPPYSGLQNAGHRALVWQTIPTPKGNVTVSTTHFTWSANGETTEKQRKELHSLFRLLDKVNPDVLCGDFNAPRGKEIYSVLSKRFVDNIPLDTKSTIDPTLHYSHKALELVVDGFFTSPSCKVTEIKLVDGVSDHLAIVGTICV